MFIRRTSGIVMVILGLAMVGVMAIICFHPSALANQLAVAIGIPGVLLGALGTGVLLVEGESLIEGPKEPAKDDEAHGHA